MGTSADFYVGRGANAEWLGSIAWDGYPEGNPSDNYLFQSKNEEEFRKEVEQVIKENDGIKVEEGWPWPWEDSRKTDYSYAWDENKVWASCFGYAWFDPAEYLEYIKDRDDDDYDYDEEEEKFGGGEEKVAVFPNMKDKQNVQLNSRGGIMLIGTNQSGEIMVE